MGDEDFAEGLKDTLENTDKENAIKSVFTNGYTQFVNKSDKLDAAISELTGFMKVLEDESAGPSGKGATK